MLKIAPRWAKKPYSASQLKFSAMSLMHELKLPHPEMCGEKAERLWFYNFLAEGMRDSNPF